MVIPSYSHCAIGDPLAFLAPNGNYNGSLAKSGNTAYKTFRFSVIQKK